MIDRRMAGPNHSSELERLDRTECLRQFVGGTFLTAPETLNLLHESQHHQ
jgi:hypothetical protein